VAFDSVKNVAVVDPLRIEALFAVLEPLIRAQIVGADVAYLSKVDCASDDEIDLARRLAGDVAPGARQLEGRAVGALSPELVRELLPWIPS
jgi:G3E family GTPase